MRRGHWMAIDFVVASFLTMLGLLAGAHPDRPGMMLPAAAFSVVVFLAVALRRLGPVTAYSALASVLAVATLVPMLAIDSLVILAMAYVLYTVTVTSSRAAGVA